MKLMESITIQHSNPWEPELDGRFLEGNDGVRFCFHDENRMVAQYPDGSLEIWYTPPEGERLELPGNWLDVRKGAPPVIRNRVPDLSEVYQFGEYTISHRGEWNYVCRHNGEEIWTFRAYAWRYTEICSFGERIFFGTAGQGGYFYLLDLKTGVPVLKLKTGGTARWIQREDRLYLLQQEKKARLLCIDLHEGAILESVQLPGKVSVHSALDLIGNTVHGVSFVYQKDRLRYALWNRVEV